MTKVGILAGGGKLPINIGKSLLHSNYDVIFFVLKISAIQNYMKIMFLKILQLIH